MPSRSSEITIPNVRLGLDARFKDLIRQLAARVSADDITDADIDHEVQVVRGAARPA